MKKRAFELSIGFIVMLILTIIVFSFGIKFVYDLVNRSTSVVEEFDEQTKKEIENMLYQGNIVAIPINQKEAGVKDSAVFGLGILNQLGKETDFKVYIRFATAVTANEEELLDIDVTEWTFEEYAVQTIKDNEHKIIPLAFEVPGGTSRGTYVFNVNVCYDDEDDGNNNQEIIDNKCSSLYPDLYDYTHQVTIVVK